MTAANKTKCPTGAETAVRTLFIDHEKSPSEGYFWGGDGLREQNIIKVTRHGQVFCTAWSWLDETRIDALAIPMLPSYRSDRLDNRGIIEKIHALYTEADIIVGHNIDRFDDRESNTEFIKHGFPPPPPHKTVDTLRIAWNKFRFTENSLGALGIFLGLGGKVEHEGFPLWEKCMAGDQRAWSKMVRYNIGDVALLKKVYFKFRPWITNHPNLTAFSERPGCPTCGADRINMIITKWRLTGTGRNPQFRCKKCGHYAAGKSTKARGWKFR